MAENEKSKQATQQNATDEHLLSLEGLLYKLTTNVIGASENGLFSKSNFENEIDKSIVRAEAALREKNYSEAYAQTYKAQRLFDEAWNAAPTWWLIRFERGWIHHLFTFLGAAMAMLLLYIIWSIDICNINKCAALFGMLGAIIRCLYWTTYQANLRMLRRVWAVQNFFAPLVGLIFGCVADFILKSTLVLVVQAKTEPNTYIAGIFVFYAGFNWEWILSFLSKAANHVRFQKGDSKDASGK